MFPDLQYAQYYDLHGAYLSVSDWYLEFFKIIMPPGEYHKTQIIFRILLITVTSKWARWRLKLLAYLLFTQSSAQRNFKAPRHWPLWEEFTTQRASNAENVSIWWRVMLCWWPCHVVRHQAIIWNNDDLVHWRLYASSSPKPLPDPHDDVIKWKHFPRYWPFVRGIHRSPVNSSHKGQWRGALMFSLICTWINDWVSNSEAGD